MSQFAEFDIIYSSKLSEKLNIKTIDTIGLMWYYRYVFDYHTIEQ